MALGVTRGYEHRQQASGVFRGLGLGTGARAHAGDMRCEAGQRAGKEQKKKAWSKDIVVLLRTVDNASFNFTTQTGFLLSPFWFPAETGAR